MTATGDVYSWGWLHPGHGAHPPALRLQRAGRVLFDDIPPERAGAEGYRPARETWEAYVARSGPTATGQADRRGALPRLIAVDAAGGPLTGADLEHAAAAIRRLIAGKTIMSLDAAAARAAVASTIPDPTGPGSTPNQETPEMADTTTTEPTATPANGKTTKSGRCQICDVDVNLKRGKVADHPAKGRPKEICNGSGLKPLEATVPDDIHVLAPTLDVARVESVRPTGAWAGAEAIALDPALCDPDPHNPRGDLTTGIDDLALSLIAQGMLEPVIVAPGPQAGRYTTVAGHRRIAAALIANLPEVPALVRADLVPGSDKSLAAQVVENLHRRELTPVEEARAYDLLRQLGYKQTDIAALVGVNQGQVSKRLLLLKLPDDIAARVGGEGPDGIDVAAAVELSRLPKAALTAALADTAAGGDADAAVRRAKTAAAKTAAHDKVVDELEADHVAVVDFPDGYYWPRDREDRPIATGKTGEPQPYRGARTIDIDYVDHADLKCHGATVSPRNEVVYVCLDPTLHGYPTPAQEAETEEAERAAADETREIERAAAAAAIEDRRAAAHATAVADIKRPVMSDAVATWAAGLLLDVESVGLNPPAIVARLLEWSAPIDVVVPDDRLDDDLDVVTARVAALVDRHGALRLAWMTVIADAEDRLDGLAYYRDPWVATGAAQAHYDRLVEIGGYTLTDTDRTILEPKADAIDGLPVALPEEEPPAGAVAWYQPTGQALDDGDAPRWILDPAEVEAIQSAGIGGRLIILEAPAADEFEVGDADPGAAPIDELPDLTVDDLGGPIIPAESPGSEATKAENTVDAGDVPVAGERCPASRRRFDGLAGDLTDVACPLGCGVTVSTTKAGYVRDHEVPEA